jgi:hypothetical protein
MHLLAQEILNPIDLRPLRLVQLPNRTHKEIRLNLIPRIELGVLTALRSLNIYPPLHRLLIPNSPFDRRIEPHMFIDFILLRNAHQIRQDLFLPRVLACPFAVLLVAERVQRGPDVAAAAGVFVVVPGAAYAGAFLEDDEVAAVVAAHEVDGCADA